MAASIRTWILIIASITFSLFIFNRWVVMTMLDDVLRARALRFQLTCLIVTFSSGMALFNWKNLSDLFDRVKTANLHDDNSKKSKSPQFYSGISLSDISKWKQFTVKSALWRSFLMLILVPSLFAYTSFSFLISNEPYVLGIFLWLCFAVSVQLFAALVVFHIVRIMLKITLKIHFPKRRSDLPKILSVLYALGLVSIGFCNTFKLPDIKEVDIPIKGLPSGLDKLTITFVSDIHLGPTVGKRSLEKVVHIINYLHSGTNKTGDFSDKMIASIMHAHNNS